MKNRQNSAEQEAYRYYFSSPWCPLFGSLLETACIPNSPLSKATEIIVKARKLWGIRSFWTTLEDIKIHHMYTENPEDFPDFYKGIPKNLLMSARRVFWRGIEIAEHARLRHSTSHPVWHQEGTGEAVEHLAPEQVEDSTMTTEARLTIGVMREIQDWQIFSLLAIAKARWILRAGLEDDPLAEDAVSLKILEWLTTATAFLAKAAELRAKSYIRATEPDRRTGKKVHQGQKLAGQGRAAQLQEDRAPIWAKWRQYAAELWRRNPRLSILEVARRCSKTFQNTEYQGSTRTVRRIISK
ncbi:MAG TPA: hypothetical protein DCZ04_14650 [Syntrophorhabdus aromaticivorans]|nr:hypothetical protein [Syntrophorhabdus aromaticivorans]